MKDLFNRMLRGVLQQLRVTMRCSTCGELFIDVSYAEFLESHSPDPTNPDKCWIEACLHYCENPEHMVISSLPDPSSYQKTGAIRETDIGSLINEKIANQGTTLQDMKEHLLKLKEKAKGNPL